MFERASELSKYWEDAIHSLKGIKNIIDIRNLGLIGAVELEPMEWSEFQQEEPITFCVKLL